MLLAESSRSGLVHQLSKSQPQKALKGSGVANVQDTPLQGQAHDHQYKSFADELGDDHLKNDRESRQSLAQSPSPRTSPQMRPRTHHSRSSTGITTQEETSDSNGLEPIYPYPDNKDVFVWKLKNPVTAVTTTFSALDTRANVDSTSLMSKTHRLMDERVKQRQRDIQRDLSGQYGRKSSLKEESFKENTSEGDVSKVSGSGKSTLKKSKVHQSPHESTSPTTSPTQQEHDWFPSLTASRNKHDKRMSSKKQFQRMLSHPTFVSNPRGIAPTPSPDASMELVRSHSVSREKQSRQEQEFRRRSEMLDKNCQLADTTNRWLMDLMLRMESQGQAMVVRSQDNYEEEDSGLMWDDEERERERERWKEALVLLEQGQIRQQQMREDLEQEREDKKEMTARIQDMSVQLSELRALPAEREQVIRLTTDVDSLSQRIQDLESQLQHQEKVARELQARHTEQVGQYQGRIGELEKQLEIEQSRLSEDQEARLRVKAQIKELVQSKEQKQDEVQELRVMLEQRDELLDHRQQKLDESLMQAHSLEVRLQEQQAEAERSQQQEELCTKHLRQYKNELREMKTELTGEKESNRQLESRIQTLIRHEQETSLMNESKIQQLEKELENRAQQLSHSSSTSSSAANAIHQLQIQIDDQERILLEKEDRIQELEQELKLAQQQAQSVVADLEQDILELEDDRSKLEELLQKSHQEVDEELRRAKALEIQLDRKDQELNHELSQRHEQERFLLEKLLTDIETMQVSGDQDVQHSLNDDGDSAEGTAQYFYFRLQERIRELKLERLYQDRALSELRQQLGQRDAEFDAQQEHMTQIESDRRNLRDQLMHLQEDLTQADSEQHQLRQQLLRRKPHLGESTREERAPNAASSEQMSSSSTRRAQGSGQRQDKADDVAIDALRSQVETLERQVITLTEEKQQLLDQLVFTQDQMQTMDGTIQDQRVAAKSIQAKYTDKIVALRQEVIKYRKMIIDQESKMFLYLSVIEKQKLQLRGIKVV
ncbi:hypothetical protein EDD11_006130 [Mortierella claussenii]|nr:hypothetical protein EDD11_006130 [Mortierella claussenii]